MMFAETIYTESFVSSSEQLENLIIIVSVLIFICISCFIIIFYVSYRTTKSLEERTKNLHIQNQIDIAISAGSTKMKHVNSASLENINNMNHLSSPSPSNIVSPVIETRMNEYNHDISILTDTTCPPLPPSIQSGHNHHHNHTALAIPATVSQAVLMAHDEESEIEGTGYEETMTTIPKLLQNNDSGFWD